VFEKAPAADGAAILLPSRVEEEKLRRGYFCEEKHDMVQDTSFFAVWAPRMLSILRIVMGALFLQHGTAKFLHVPQVASMHDVQLMSLVGAAGALELVGGVLLLIGLFTRPVAFVLSGEMAFAYFIAHAQRGAVPLLNGGELAVVYCFVFLYFAIAGGGPWGVGGRGRSLYV
jgi:putative oxidoreductase